MSNLFSACYTPLDTISSKSRQPVILVGGGVGPAAGVKFHDMLLRLTPNVATDRDHLDLIHFGRVSDMPDRTGFLDGSSTDNPGVAMARYMAPVVRALADEGRGWAAAVPCCTFHTPAIFKSFLAEIDSFPGHGKVVNLINETVLSILSSEEAPKRIGILSTHGSRRMRTWATPLINAGLIPIELTQEDAGYIHASIYHPEFGLKAVIPPGSRAINEVVRAWEVLRLNGAEAVLLGCTELSLVADSLRDLNALVIDPLEVLARRCVELGKAPSRGEEKS